MDSERKGFYKSKTFWAGMLGIVTGISILAQGGDMMAGLGAIVGGIGAILGRVQATKPLGFSTTDGGHDDGTTGRG